MRLNAPANIIEKKRVAKAVGILSRVAKLIRVYALQQHTMREVNQLRDKFADGLTKKDSEMLHAQVRSIRGKLKSMTFFYLGKGASSSHASTRIIVRFNSEDQAPILSS